MNATKKFIFFIFLAVLQINFISGTCCYRKPVLGCDSTVPLLKIQFPQKTIDSCEPLTVNDKSVFQTTPEVSFPAADPNNFYTLVMIDPDAPNHLEGEAWLHWLVANIKGSSLAVGDLSKGFVAIPYKPPGPPKGTGDHRYLTYVFSEPPADPNAVPLTTISNRRAFKLEDYACERGLCEVLAYNMFKSKYTE